MSMPRGLLGLILFILIAGAFWSATHRDPWDPDETRYLQVTKETMAGGNPLFLRFNGEPYTDKPPLFFWLLAPFVALFGAESAVAGMIPSVLALLGLALATGRLGRAADLEPRAVDWAVIMVPSSLLPAVLVGGCRMDLLLALWMTLALEQLVHLARDMERGRHHLLLWLWITLAIYTKGPVALVLLVLAAVAVVRRNPKLPARMLWGPGLPLALIALAVWLVPAALEGGRSWLEVVLIHQSAGRLSSSFAHQEPWWYHLATIPITLMPWSLLVLPASLAALVRPQVLVRHARIIAIFPVATLIFLSLLSGKTFLYPLPLFPPVCLLAAWWLARAPKAASRRFVVALAGAMAVVVAVGCWMWVAPHPDMHLSGMAAAVLSLSIGLPGAVALVMAVAGRTGIAVTALALAVPLFVGVGLQRVVTRFDALLSLRPLAAAYQQEAGPGSRAAAFGKIEPGFVLFSGRSFDLLRTPEELATALANDRVVAINVKDARRLEEEYGLEWQVAAEVGYRHTQIQLIRAAAPAPEPATAAEQE